MSPKLKAKLEKLKVSGQSKRAERGIYAASPPGCPRPRYFLGAEAYRTLKWHKCRAPPAFTEALQLKMNSN